jgi:hypothetical protein
MTRMTYFQVTGSKIIVAQVLAGTALVLTLVEAIAGPQMLTPGHMINMSTTGHVVGIIATLLSAAAFALSVKKRSYLLPGLLLVTGIITTTHVMMFLGDFSIIVFPGPIVGFIFGLVILGLGVAKAIETVRMTAGTASTSTPNGHTQHERYSAD